MADEQGLQCVRGNEGQEAGLSQIELHSAEAVTTLRRGPGGEQEEELISTLRSSQSVPPVFPSPHFSLVCFPSPRPIP